MSHIDLFIDILLLLSWGGLVLLKCSNRKDYIIYGSYCCAVQMSALIVSTQNHNLTLTFLANTDPAFRLQLS